MSPAATADDAIAFIKAIYGGWTRGTSVTQMRADWDAAFAPRAASWPRVTVEAGGVPAEWIAPPGLETNRTILYLHGGGFRLGSLDSHRDLMQRLALAAQARLLAVDYRLAPEHRWPAAHDDAFAAWRWLVSEAGGDAVIAGDSAGAGLVACTMLRARDEGVPLPRAALMMSPWTDLAATGASYETHAALDPIHQRAMLLGMTRGYLGKDHDPRDPRVSPLFADLAGLLPLCIQCGERETILDDSRVFADRARAAGVPVDLAVFDGMIHVFQMFGELPQAQDALADAARFLFPP